MKSTIKSLLFFATAIIAFAVLLIVVSITNNGFIGAAAAFLTAIIGTLIFIQIEKKEAV